MHGSTSKKKGKRKKHVTIVEEVSEEELVGNRDETEEKDIVRVS